MKIKDIVNFGLFLRIRKWLNFTTMINLSSNQLRAAADLRDKIAELESELATLLSGGGNGVPFPATALKPLMKKGMSAAGRARIAAAQKARWAKVKGGTEKVVKALVAAAKPADVTKPGKIKRTFSAAHLAKIRAAAKKRWAKAKAAGKNRL